MVRSVFFLVVFGFTYSVWAASNAFDAGRAGFSVTYRGLTIPYRMFALYGLPNERLELQMSPGPDSESYEVEFRGRGSSIAAGQHFSTDLPEQHGVYPLRIKRVADDQTMVLNLFVLRPASQIKNGALNGYPIGQYPPVKGGNAGLYAPPKAFIELTKDNVTTRLSPHFTLSQFPSKQRTAYPKYLVLRERLLLKLELLLEELNKAGVTVSGFHVLSGYRTPFYNKAIGNVSYSRHQWGGAADIFIDESPRDGIMDDLNKDGKITEADAKWLYDFIDGLFGKSFYEPYHGGLGQYRANQAHGPFVHVDVRGSRARWRN